MQKQISAAATSRSTITWLADPSGAQPASGVDHTFIQHSVPLPESIGKGSLETIRFAPGLLVTRCTHRFKHDLPTQMLPIAEARFDLPEPALVVHSARVGNAVIRISADGEGLPVNDAVDAFQHFDRQEYLLSVDTSQSAELTSLFVSDGILSELCGASTAHLLLSTLRLHGTPSASTFVIPRRISNTLHSSLLTTLDGELRALFAKSKVLEYLSLLANFVTAGCASLNSPRRQQLMRELYDELVSLDGKAPSLKDLAERYAMSAKTLNDAFRQAHGQTIGAFIAEQRLNEAHVALQETDTPIKVLANRFGYSHANNFITAFKRKFGYPPGSLRRGTNCPPVSFADRPMNQDERSRA